MIKRNGGPFAPHDKSRRAFLTRSASFAGLAATSSLLNPSFARASGTLNFLTWCDHVDPRMVALYEGKTGNSVQSKIYEGTGAALSIKDQSSKGDWDLFCVDFQDTPIVAGKGYLAELDDSRVPWDKIFPAIRNQPHSYSADGKLYGIPTKFGYYGLAYNKDKVDPADARTAEIMWNEKYKGRIAVYDYYLPIIQLVGLSQGLRPQDITVENLPSNIREPLLKLKPQTRVVGDIVTVLNALHGGSTDMIIGGAEWLVALDMANNPALDFITFDEGALMWNEALSIFADARNPEASWAFIEAALSPEGQRFISTSECAWANPVRMDAALTAEEAGILRWEEQAKVLERAIPSSLAGDELDYAMLDLWQEFLAA